MSVITPVACVRYRSVCALCALAAGSLINTSAQAALVSDAVIFFFPIVLHKTLLALNFVGLLLTCINNKELVI